MAKKTREDVTKEILDIDFDDTSKAKVFDDDGYEDLSILVLLPNY